MTPRMLPLLGRRGPDFKKLKRRRSSHALHWMLQRWEHSLVSTLRGERQASQTGIRAIFSKCPPAYGLTWQHPGSMSCAAALTLTAMC